MSVFYQSVDEERCFLYNRGTDSLEHLQQCSVTQELVHVVVQSDNDAGLILPESDMHLFQCELTQLQVERVLKINHGI